MRGAKEGPVRTTSSASRWRDASLCKSLRSHDDEVRVFSLVTTEQELDPEDTFFGSLHLSPNGGLYEVRGLYTPLRYVGATIFVTVLVLNVRSVCARALAAIVGETVPQDLLAHERLLQRLAPHQLTPQVVVAWFELCCLLLYLLQVSGDLRIILFSRRRDSSEEYRYWRRVSSLMKDLLPGLQSFSAMKVLKNVTPPVLNADLVSLLKHLRTASKEKSSAYKLLRLAWFVLRRVLLFAFGFEAFLMKFRDVASSLSALPGAELRVVCRLLIFLNQMLGVVQLNMFASERLFRFIFGGVDNFVDPCEHRKMCVWKAALVRRIWDEFKASPSKFFAVAITFNDVDFQRLVLDDDDGKAEADSPGWYTVLHDGVSVTDDGSVTSGIRARLGSGTRVKVLEVLGAAEANRLRARIEHPKGWISLVNVQTGYRWASRQAT